MDEWNASELAAAVEAYLQMLSLEQMGEKYNKAAVQRMLIANRLKGRTSAEHRMQNISYVLESMGRARIKGYKPLSNVGDQSADKIKSIIVDLTGETAVPIPLRPPVAASEDRKLPPTGYWMFVCKRSIWDGEAFLRDGKNELLYKVSSHNHAEVQPGDFGILRLNRRADRKDRPGFPPAVYAIVQVTGSPQQIADPVKEYYADLSDAAKISWRVPLTVLANLADSPISIPQLPSSEDFDLLRNPVQTSSIPISREAFADIYQRTKIFSVDALERRSADTLMDVRLLEIAARNADPKRQRRISAFIERGTIGKKVKAARNGRCQVCEVLGQEPVAFNGRNGTPYSEAHHVQPVSLLLSGSLAASNIMVLCPNHHRQAHYGAFEVIESKPKSWIVRLETNEVEIPRTVIST